MAMRAYAMLVALWLHSCAFALPSEQKGGLAQDGGCAANIKDGVSLLSHKRASFAALEADAAPVWLKPCPQVPGFLRLESSVSKCFKGITKEQLEMLDTSSGFCPDARNQQADPMAIKGGCNSTSHSCTYIKGVIDQKPAAAGGAPGLYAEQRKMLFQDPSYVYPKGSALAIANAPMEPWVNVNQVYEDGERTLWAGQCPLASGAKAANKTASVCGFLNFIKTSDIKMILSLAPNLDEKIMPKEKLHCEDYIKDRAGMDYDGATGTVCGGQKYSMMEASRKSWTVMQSVENAEPVPRQVSVVTRRVEFGGHMFKQVYFDGYADYFRPEGVSTVPVYAGLRTMLDSAEPEKRVLVHCAAGKGRSGTLVTGLIQVWKGPPITPKRIVEDLVKVRQRRAAMIEGVGHLLVLGPVLGLTNGTQCPLKEGYGA